MLGRVFSTVAALAVYAAIATLLAQVLVVGFAAWKWNLNRDRLIQILAIAQGIDLFAMREEALGKPEMGAAEELSFDEIRTRRALALRNLERREDSLQNALEQLQIEQQSLAEQRRQYKQVYAAFETELNTLRTGALAEGMDEVRRILESVKPAQAKGQLLQMLDNDELDTVVQLLAEMPDQKRAKIIGEFESPQEEDKIAEVLKRILQGVPDGELVTASQEKLQEAMNPAATN